MRFALVSTMYIITCSLSRVMNAVLGRMHTLGSIIGEFNVEDGSVLKMYCVGCEYEIVLRTNPEDLGVFSQVFIECHNGYK